MKDRNNIRDKRSVSYCELVTLRKIDICMALLRTDAAEV